MVCPQNPQVIHRLVHSPQLDNRENSPSQGYTPPNLYYWIQSPLTNANANANAQNLPHRTILEPTPRLTPTPKACFFFSIFLRADDVCVCGTLPYIKTKSGQISVWRTTRPRGRVVEDDTVYTLPQSIHNSAKIHWDRAKKCGIISLLMFNLFQYANTYRTSEVVPCTSPKCNKKIGAKRRRTKRNVARSSPGYAGRSEKNV